jgi:trimeric autotransporter adhesin
LKMTVLPTPSVSQPLDIAVCSNEVISTQFSGTLAETTFQWTNDNPTINLPTTGLGNLNRAMVTNYSGVLQVATITVTPHLQGCMGLPKTFKIVVKPAPILATTAFNVCVNDSAHFELKTNLKASLTTAFVWSSSNTYTGIESNGDSNVLIFKALSNKKTEVATSYLTVWALADGCQATTQIAINVKPRPILLNPGNMFVTAGQRVAVHFLSDTEGTSFEWTNDKSGIGLPKTGSGDLNFMAEMNNSNTPITANIVATPSFDGCVEQAQMFSITLTPTPSVSTPLANK